MEVDVKISELLDNLTFTPRKKEDARLLRDILNKSNPDLSFHRTAQGIWLEAMDGGKVTYSNLGININWTEEAEKFVSNRQKALRWMPTVVKQIKSIQLGGKAAAMTYLPNSAELKVLDDHQFVNVACMALPNSCGLCVFDEQGAGKTVTLIFAFDLLVEKDEVDFALIIAPKSMVSEWPVDFSRFMPKRYNIQTITGSRSAKKKILSNKSDVIVTNFETAVSMEQELRAVLRNYGSRGILVIDESFFAKNLDAQRTQSIRRLREYCGRAFVLCGTPAPNSPVDLVQQFNIVDFGFTFAGVSIPKDKAQTADVIKQIIDERGPFVRHLKSDVLPNLPEKKFNRITIEMQPKQFQLYRNISDNLINDLKEINDSVFEKNKMSFLARRSALLQICSNPLSIDNRYSETPAKILAIDKILEELIARKNEKVILWSFYTASIESMFLRYRHYNAVRYDGTITDTNIRRDAVRRFKEDKQTMLFIGNPAAAGAGLNLQSARYAIYESMSNQAAHYLQSLDRIHRRGQENEVEYLILLCNETIEISEYNL